MQPEGSQRERGVRCCPLSPLLSLVLLESAPCTSAPCTRPSAPAGSVPARTRPSLMISTHSASTHSLLVLRPACIALVSTGRCCLPICVCRRHTPCSWIWGLGFMACCSLRAKLSHALALLRAYQSRLRAAHAPTAAAPALLARPGALGAAGAPTASAPPALPAPRAASEEVWSSRSAAEGHCPTCCQRVAGTGGSAGDRVRADANPAAAPPHPDALTDLAASLLAWQLRRGGASLEWLGSAPRGQGSKPEPASASMRALPQSVAGAAGGGRALRFDPASGRSGAFVYEDAAEPTGSQATSRSTAAACAPATADSLPGSGAGQHSGGSTGSRGQGGRRAAAAADPTAGEAGAQGAAHVAAPGAVLADRRGGSSCQVAGGAAEGAAGGEARRWAGSSVAGSLATGAAGSGQRPGPAVGLPSAVDAPWQHAHAADEREGLQAAVHAEAVQTQLRKQPAKTNALAAR